MFAIPGSTDTIFTTLFELFIEDRPKAKEQVLEFSKQSEEYKLLCQNLINNMKESLRNFKRLGIKNPVLIPYLGYQLLEKQFSDVPLLCLNKQKHSNDFWCKWDFEELEEVLDFSFWLTWLLYHRFFHDRVVYTGLLVYDTSEGWFGVVKDSEFKARFPALEIGLDYLARSGPISSREAIIHPDHLADYSNRKYIDQYVAPNWTHPDVRRFVLPTAQEGSRDLAKINS